MASLALSSRDTCSLFGTQFMQHCQPGQYQQPAAPVASLSSSFCNLLLESTSSEVPPNQQSPCCPISSRGGVSSHFYQSNTSVTSLPVTELYSHAFSNKDWISSWGSGRGPLPWVPALSLRSSGCSLQPLFLRSMTFSLLLTSQPFVTPIHCYLYNYI